MEGWGRGFMDFNKIQISKLMIKKYFLFSLLFAAVNLVVLLVFFVPRFNHTDTVQYVATVNYVLGNEEGELYLNRLLYPASILISASLNPILSPENAFIFQNIIFYFLSVILIFFLVAYFYKDKKQAFYGTVLFVTAYPVLAYGIAVLTDFSGWFFYLAAILLSLCFYKSPDKKNALIIGFIAALGMLFKESAAATAMFFASLVFVAIKISFKEKLKYLFLFGFAFSLPIIINSAIFYKLYSYSYWERYIDVVHDKTGGLYAYSPLRMAMEIGRVFALGWLFILLGILREISLKNKERSKFLIALILPSISFLFWAFPHNRIIFIAFPYLILLGSFGLAAGSNKLSDFSRNGLLIAYVLLNYLTLEFLLQWGPVLQYKF